MSIARNGIEFYTFEKEIFEWCCSLGRSAVKTMLEQWDNDLAESRDRALYRHKGKRKTTIKTVMGEVEYERCIFEEHCDDGSTRFVYPLDETMGTGSGFMSGLLSEQIVKCVCGSTYRGAADAVSEMTGQHISHTAVWQVVQKVGGQLEKQEEDASQRAGHGDGTGTLETKVLFEEQDGIWLHLQGKDRKEQGVNKEMKLAIAYDGAKEVGKKRYKLTNKVACANFEGANEFEKRKEGVIAETYNVDEIETRLLNGDGASWIRQAITDETVHFQLDPFHRNKAIRQWVFDPEMQEEIFDLLYAKKIDELLVYIEALSNSVEDEKERDNLLSLLTYFTNNKDGLVPCHRRGLNLPQPPEGVEYRHMGTMESNIFTVVGNRMKGRRACWSVNGGNNLARLLCLKFTDKLHSALQSLTEMTLPEKYAEEITVPLTAAKAPKHDGKGFEPHRAGAFPAIPEYKFLRNIGSC